MNNVSSNYGLSPQGLQESNLKQTINRIMVLQVFAQDLCILQAVRELSYYLREYGQISEDKLPTDPYLFPTEIIIKLDKLSKNDEVGVKVLDAFKRCRIYATFQEMWSYAIACPKIIHDFYGEPATNTEDPLSVYRTTDRGDPKILKAYDEVRDKTFLNNLAKANHGTPLQDPTILQCCLDIALHVGRINDNSQSNEEKVVKDVFREDFSYIKDIDKDANFTQLVNDLMHYIPDDIVGILNSTFLYSINFAWQKLFSDYQSNLFDIIYNRIINIEGRFTSSKPSESQLDYKNETDEFMLNTLSKWKIPMRMQELWELSRDPSPIAISAALKSLDTFDKEQIYKINIQNKQKKSSSKKNNTEKIIMIRKTDEKEITDQDEVKVGETLNIICDKLKSDTKYAIVLIKGSETVMSKPLPDDGSLSWHIPSYLLPGVYSIYLILLENDEKYTKITERTLNISSSISITPGAHWPISEDSTGRIGWNYLFYFSLLSRQKIVDLFIFAGGDKIRPNEILPSALYPEIDDSSYNVSAPTSKLDFDKIVRNNLLIGERLSKAGALKSATKEVGDLL